MLHGRHPTRADRKHLRYFLTTCRIYRFVVRFSEKLNLQVIDRDRDCPLPFSGLRNSIERQILEPVHQSQMNIHWDAVEHQPMTVQDRVRNSFTRRDCKDGILFHFRPPRKEKQKAICTKISNPAATSSAHPGISSFDDLRDFVDMTSPAAIKESVN